MMTFVFRDEEFAGLGRYNAGTGFGFRRGD